MNRRNLALIFVGLLWPGTAVAGELQVAMAFPDEGPAIRMSLEDSAEAGDPLSLFVAGRRLLINGKNEDNQGLIERGLSYMNRAAEKGYAPAARFAGSLFLTGDTLPKDITQAVAWFERAAMLGDSDSQRVLGDLYFYGNELPRDLGRAAKWYEVVFANSNAHGEPKEYWETVFRLGGIYSGKFGAHENGPRAIKLWQLAAADGSYPPAAEALGHAYRKGLGGDPDPKAALDAYYNAASGYRSGAVQYGINPETVTTKEREILTIMEQFAPKSRQTKKLKAALRANSPLR